MIIKHPKGVLLNKYPFLPRVAVRVGKGSGYARLTSSMEYKFLPRPSNASELTPAEARALFRRNDYYSATSGFCAGFVQANVVILPGSVADDFQSFCKINSGPFPLLYRSKPGEFESPPLASNADIR